MLTWNQPLWDAFHVLSAGRIWSDGIPAAIKFSEIREYLEFLEYTKQEIIDAIFLIREMDSVYSAGVLETRKESMTNGRTKC